MTWPPPAHLDDLPRAFLVERYLSPVAAVDLASSAARLGRLCGGADGVRYLFSAYLPGEDTCFCLFRAPSPEAVREVNRRARFAFDRLIDAVLMHGQGSSS